MARPLDFTALTRAERAVLLSGALLFADGFVPWWYRVETDAGTYSYNAGLTGWGIAAIVAGAVAAIGVMLRAAIWPEPAPQRDGSAYAGLGAVATLSTLFELMRSNAGWFGLWIGLALGIALVVAGIRRRAERQAGWT